MRDRGRYYTTLQKTRHFDLAWSSQRIGYHNAVHSECRASSLVQDQAETTPVCNETESGGDEQLSPTPTFCDSLYYKKYSVINIAQDILPRVTLSMLIL